MHNGKIENYNFVHGLHRNMITGKWFPLHPHKLGRALTHDEMDYNLLYSQQTIAGWRIFGQNEDLTLNDNELGNHLIFWKISENDLDYQRYVSAGYSAGQYIWITPLFDCDDFVILSESSSKTSLDQCDNFTIQLVSTTDAIDACASFGVTEEGSTLAIYATPVPTATATPEPTATEVPPTATPEPTATEVPPTATPAPTATEVPPTATPAPTSPPVYSNLLWADRFSFSGQWWSTESYGPGIDPELTGQPRPDYVNQIYIDYFDNISTNLSALMFRNEVNATINQTGGSDSVLQNEYQVLQDWVNWEPWDFFGHLNFGSLGTFKLQAISDLSYSKYNRDSNVINFPLNVNINGGLSYIGNGIGQLEVGMELYGRNGSSNRPSQLYGSGAILVSQTEGGPYSPNDGQIYELPQGDFQDEVKSMQSNGTSLRYVIYENWIVKRIVDVAPTTNAIYPRLGYYDNQDWNTLVDDWFAANPNCSNGSGSPSAVTNFITGKLVDAGIDVPSSGSGVLSSSHRTRHILWLYVNVFGGTLDTALLEEFGIDQGCVPNATPVPTATEVPPTATPVLPTPTPTPTVSVDSSVYYFHLGANQYPWGRDLINDQLFKADDSVAANYGESFEDMLANPDSYEPVGELPELVNGTTFTMPASITANFYWIAIPVSAGIPDLTVTPKIEISGAPADICSDKLNFVRDNGEEYTLYKLNAVSTAGSIGIKYVN